jgi:chromosome segregation ATPase
LKKAAQEYSYYSRVLKEPFETVEELRKAEEAYYAKLKAKEDAVATKKADAKKVEDAFKALNAARKTYKDDLTALTKQYSEDLVSLKTCFEKYRDEIKATLAEAEETYQTSLKTFTEKYPEGFHLTLKDGDFETTISSSGKIQQK